MPLLFCGMGRPSGPQRMRLHRRDLLSGTALLLLSGLSARASILQGALPWVPNGGSPPEPVRPGPWRFFTSDEVRAIEALADRIIPPDPETPGGQDAGCAVCVDGHAAGPDCREGGRYLPPPP